MHPEVDELAFKRLRHLKVVKHSAIRRSKYPGIKGLIADRQLKECISSTGIECVRKQSEGPELFLELLNQIAFVEADGAPSLFSLPERGVKGVDELSQLCLS